MAVHAHSHRVIARLVVASFLMVAASLGLSVHAAEPTALQQALQQALDAPSRTEAERARDRNRKPIETLEFFGLEQDMRVLELLPGGGWYTKILAPVLAEKGELMVAIGTQNIEAMQEAGKLESVKVLPVDMSSFARVEGSRRFNALGLTLDVKKLDLVLTFRNLHNMAAPSRDLLNREVLKALKPGGLYGVVDHTRRHMQADSSENWRRMDPVQMIKEIEAAGFEFVDYSDVHYRLDDELRYEVGRRAVSGNTDRFTLLFRKP